MTTTNEFPEELKDLSMEDVRGWVLDMTLWGSAVIELDEVEQTALGSFK